MTISYNTAKRLEGENWTFIRGYLYLYEVSNTGRVRSYKYSSPRILKQYPVKGYKRVQLFNHAGSGKNFLVHRLVAEHFCDGYKDGLEVNHKDGNPANNISSNLEWVNRSQNVIHAFKNGLMRPALGENARTAKLTAKEVGEIRSKYSRNKYGEAKKV